MSLVEVDRLDRIAKYRSEQTIEYHGWQPLTDWALHMGCVGRVHHGEDRIRSYAVYCPRGSHPARHFDSFNEAWQYLECWRLLHGMNEDGSPR